MKSKVIHTLVLIGAVTVRLCLIRPQVALADEDERTWSFDDDAVGSVPEGWEVAETAGRGTPAAWKVVTGCLVAKCSQRDCHNGGRQPRRYLQPPDRQGHELQGSRDRGDGEGRDRQ